MIDTAERRLTGAEPRVSTRTPEPRRTQEDWFRAFETWKSRKLVAVGRDRRLVS